MASCFAAPCFADLAQAVLGTYVNGEDQLLQDRPVSGRAGERAREGESGRERERANEHSLRWAEGGGLMVPEARCGPWARELPQATESASGRLAALRRSRHHSRRAEAGRHRCRSQHRTSLGQDRPLPPASDDPMIRREGSFRKGKVPFLEMFSTKIQK